MEHVIPARPDAEKKSLRAAEQARADIAEARRVWRELQPGLQPEKLVFLDESWAKTNMTRLYGRSPRGTRLVGAVPFGHWNTTTFVAGLRHDRLVAPMVLNGAMNGRAFRAWVEQCLAPTLDHGDTVIADNLGSHKVGGVRDAIEARGARLLFLPAYSPDLLCQVKSPAPAGRPENTRDTMEHHRPQPRPLQPSRMRQLHPPLRLRIPSLKPL